MLLSIIRKNEKLADRRSPIFSKNRFTKIFIYFMIAFWAAYLIFIGVMLSFAFADAFPGMEPYHILNKFLIIILILDFLLRFMVQPATSQEIKPYLLFPIKKNKLIYTFLLQSGLSSYNLFWFFLFVPFALLTIPKYFGITGVVLYLIGIWMLMIMNNYWQKICQSMFKQGLVYYLIPLIVYGTIACIEFIPNGELFSTFSMNLGEGFILGNPISFIEVLALILLLFYINRSIQLHYMYNELSQVEDTKPRTISEFKFLDSYGEIGDYLRLELKLALRNKTVKHQARMGFVIMIAFSCLLAFTDIYDGSMSNFICIYNFSIFGILYMGTIMSYEGNYMDGLMSRKGSILNIIRSKYYINCIVLIIPFLFLLIPVIKAKLPFLMIIAYLLFTAGFVLCMLMQLAIYNKTAIPLNSTIMKTNRGNNVYQMVINMMAIFLPLIVNWILTSIFEPTIAYIIIALIGLAFIVTSNIWIKNIYSRFMKRRYENMDSFRSSRS